LTTETRLAGRQAAGARLHRAPLIRAGEADGHVFIKPLFYKGFCKKLEHHGD
jgi:hypothetical protein